MSVYSDVLTAVCQLINDTAPYSNVVIGSLPPSNGISIAWAASTNNPFWDKYAAVEMTAVLNGKHPDQSVVLDGLGKIHTALSLMKQYPSADHYQITDIATISAPSYLGREENNEWLYGSSLRVKFYLRGN